MPPGTILRTRGHTHYFPRRPGGRSRVPAASAVTSGSSTRGADPASVGVVIGAAPLVIIIIAAAIGAGPPARPPGPAGRGGGDRRIRGGPARRRSPDRPGARPGCCGRPGHSAGVGGLDPAGRAGAAPARRPRGHGVRLRAGGRAGCWPPRPWSGPRAGRRSWRMPTATQLAALAYLTIAVTAVVFIAWFGAMERLGADRTGLFNGLIPVTSLAAVVLTGTGTLTPLRLLGALAVLAGVILGLGRVPQDPAGTVNPAALRLEVVAGAISYRDGSRYDRDQEKEEDVLGPAISVGPRSADANSTRCRRVITSAVALA